MTDKQLELANLKKKQISELEGYITKCDAQVCDNIIFTFGNHSNRSTVCVDSDIIERIIKKINEQYKNQINDIVTVFGFIFSREDFETKFKMRVENGMLYPLDKKDESDIDRIKSKNSEMFNIDDILDKINDVGIDSLSNEERAFLKSFKS